MLDSLESLESAVASFEAQADDYVDLKRLAAVIDRLQGNLCHLAHEARQRGDHLLVGQSACTWVARTCSISPTSAADRLCVGEQLEAMPRVAAAISSGEIGYQATSVICHLQKHVSEIEARIDEEMWIANAKRFSLKDLRDIATSTWHAVDPEGFGRAVEESFERRQLFISESNGMYRLDGWLEAEGGAAVKTAIDALAKPLGSADQRSNKQRRADALVEMAHHAMSQGTLPRRNGVRPHITVHTTVEGLKGELGAPASELEPGLPVSSQTVQRLACDGTLSRVLKAGSVGGDVGRATRSGSPAQWRGAPGPGPPPRPVIARVRGIRCCTVFTPRGVNVMVFRRPSCESRLVWIRPRSHSRETTSAIVDRSSETRSPRVRWSRYGSPYRAFSAANWGEVIVCETSSSHSRFITWTARRRRCPGCSIRSSACCPSRDPFFTFRLHDSISHREQAQAEAFLDRPP